MTRVLFGLALTSTLALGCGGSPASAPPPATPAPVASTGVTSATVTLTAPPMATPWSECLGHWVGIGTQLNGMEWPIDLLVTASDGSTCGTIEYPTLGCGGYVVDCTLLPDGHVYLREVYTHNDGSCAPAGNISAYCSRGRMSWTWTGDGEAANATLDRR